MGIAIMHKLLSAIAIILFFGISNAQEQPFGLDEKVGDYLPEGLFVLNEDSVTVELNVLIDKPTLLSFVYYHCPSLCPKTLAGIAELVNYSEALPAENYQVITISIDQNEGSSLANETKKKYYQLIEKPVDRYFWRFFTADSASIQKLTEATGWDFRRDGDDFVHTTSSMLITPGGMISQYFYGTYFNYMHFDMSLKIAANEEVMPTRLKTLKYCYNYKPAKNNRVVVLTTSFGILMLVIMLSLFFLMNFQTKKSGNVE